MTKDPITVLREALELAAVWIEAIKPEEIELWRGVKAAEIRRALRVTAPAAIQPAGEVIGYVEPSDVAYLIEAMAQGRKTAIQLRSFSSDPLNATVPLYLGAPVSAPVPEAKAEQSLQALADQAQELGLYAAPAVKHEASELPKLPEPTIEGSVMHPELKICYRAPVHFTADQMRAYVLSDRAARQSPPITVQGSIEDIADFCLPAHPVPTYINDSTGAAWDMFDLNDLENYARESIKMYIDARSPVAAPDSARDAARYRWLQAWYFRDGKRAEIDPYGHIHRTTKEVMDAAIDRHNAALAATAASSGEKGAGDE